MVLIRPTAFRAPLARFARPATRSSPLQSMFQRAARRGYASATEATKKAATSDLPWLAAGVGITVPSVAYILSTIETGGHHGDGHGEHGEEHHEEEEKEEPEEKEESKDEGEGEDKKDDKDDKKDESKDKKEDKKEDKKDDGNGDKPDARKEPVKGGTSGKQEGISNADTKHSTDTHDGSKSTKGEGVAETAKLKGTVESDRNAK